MSRSLDASARRIFLALVARIVVVGLVPACSPTGEQAGSQTNWLSLEVLFHESSRHETLIGFGASITFAEDEVATHPDAAALYDAMFSDSGLEVVRMRNRYETGAEDEIAAIRDILAAASARFDTEPLLLMTSGSPPGNLKANGTRFCSGDLETCTLAELGDGTFDYDGFANHWRDSLEAHAAAGIEPDYVSIQNNPDWIPPSGSTNDACRFLPEEGTETVRLEGAPVDIRYPGYGEALARVAEALDTLPAAPRFLGPETTGAEGVADYAPHLGAGPVAAIGYHLYGAEPASQGTGPLTALGELARDAGLPLFQTEMRADGLDTAILVQRAMTAAGSVMYLQNDFVISAASLNGDPHGLIALSDDSFTLQGPYHALRHYALRTAPGWIRVDAAPNDERLLATAWISPDEDALTIVLVNPGSEGIEAELQFADARAAFAESEVIRTVFDGDEAFASLGELSPNSIVPLPGGSVATVAFWGSRP